MNTAGSVVVPVDRIRSSPDSTEKGWYEIRGPDEEQSLRTLDGLSKIELSFVCKAVPRGLATTEGHILLLNEAEEPQRWESCFLIVDPYSQILRCFEQNEGRPERGTEIAALNLRGCKVTEDKPKRRPLNGSKNCFMVANKWEALFLCAGTAEEKVLCMRAITAAADWRHIAHSIEAGQQQRETVPSKQANLPVLPAGSLNKSALLPPSPIGAMLPLDRHDLRASSPVHELEDRYEAARRALSDYLAKIRTLEVRVRQLEEAARTAEEAAARSQADNSNVIEYLKDKSRGLAEALADANRRADEVEEASRAQADSRVAAVQAQLDATNRALAEHRRKERDLLRVQEEQAAALARGQVAHDEAQAGRRAAAELLAKSEELEAARRCSEAQQLALERLESRRAAEARELSNARAEAIELRAELAEARRELERLADAQTRQQEEMAALRAALGRARVEGEAAVHAARLAEAARGAARAEALEEELRQASIATAEAERRAQESARQVADLEEAFGRARAEAQTQARASADARAMLEQISAERIAPDSVNRGPREDIAGPSRDRSPLRNGARSFAGPGPEQTKAWQLLPPGQRPQSPGLGSPLQKSRTSPRGSSQSPLVGTEEGGRLHKARALIADIAASLSRRATSPLASGQAVSPQTSGTRLSAGSSGWNGASVTTMAGRSQDRVPLPVDRSPLSFDDFLRG